MFGEIFSQISRSYFSKHIVVALFGFNIVPNRTAQRWSYISAWVWPDVDGPFPQG